MTTLVVAATKAEAAHVPAALEVLITGIGKTAAAATVASALAVRDGITQVINIGTAGALHDGLDGLHEVGRVLNHDISADALRQLGFDPMEWLDLSTSDVALASGDVFVTDPLVRARLAVEAQLVDMEGYAIAWACRRHGVPVRLVKHVSDNADEGAMSWPEVVDLSARELGAWLAANA
jgi:nucleoside phosphorylase